MKLLGTTLTLIVAASMATALPCAGADRQKGRKLRPRTRPAATKLVLAPIAGASAMAGTWTLRDGDQPRKDIRMVFRPNGTFAFVGPNWKSEGTYRMAEHKLSLEWSKVDGAPVKAGTVKKDIVMPEDDCSFTIDRYTYFKL